MTEDIAVYLRVVFRPCSSANYPPAEILACCNKMTHSDQVEFTSASTIWEPCTSTAKRRGGNCTADSLTSRVGLRTRPSLLPRRDGRPRPIQGFPTPEGHR